MLGINKNCRNLQKTPEKQRAAKETQISQSLDGQDDGRRMGEWNGREGKKKFIQILSLMASYDSREYEWRNISMAHFYGTTLCTQRPINNTPKITSSGNKKRVERETTREDCCDCKGTLAEARDGFAFMSRKKGETSNCSYNSTITLQ